MSDDYAVRVAQGRENRLRTALIEQIAQILYVQTVTLPAWDTADERTKDLWRNDAGELIDELRGHNYAVVSLNRCDWESFAVVGTVGDWVECPICKATHQYDDIVCFTEEEA
jgi:hypothetical protein